MFMKIFDGDVCKLVLGYDFDWLNGIFGLMVKICLLICVSVIINFIVIVVGK